MGTSAGYLLIADITGYTAFLHDSELEHAQDILTTLLKLLLEETREPMIVSRTAGDAVISYAVGEPFLQGQTMVERLEHTYGTFREGIDRMVLNNRCTCSACANVASLDLKFFLHYGEFGVQDLGGHDELVGSDVNLIHRLLKNSVVETTGFPAYALYTKAALDRLGLDEWRQTLTPHSETYDHLGEVEVCIQDLRPIAEAARARNSKPLPPDEVRQQLELEIAAPVELVWDALNDPERRRTMIGSSSMARAPTDGRMGVDSQFICYHGKLRTDQEIVVYEPFRRLITRDRLKMAGGTFVTRIEYELESTGEGTRLTERFGYAEAAWYYKPVMSLFFVASIGPNRKRLLEDFKAEVEASAAV